MKTQFEQILNKGRLNEKKIDASSGLTGASIDQLLSGRMPWQRAAALRSKKLEAQVPSCVRNFHREKTRPRS